MRVSAEPLIEVAAALGISTDDLVAAEHVNRLFGTFAVGSPAVAGLTTELLGSFVGEYGAAARLVISTGVLAELTVHGSVDSQAHQRLVDDARSTVASYNVTIDIQKPALTPVLLSAGAHLTTHLFFFARSLETRLARGPKAVEDELWSDPGTRLALVVLDTDVLVVGDYLSIIGGSHLESLTPEVTAAPMDDIARIASRRNDFIAWDTNVTTRLAPKQFCHATSAGDERLPAQLDVLVAGLAAMYLCDRCRSVEKPGQDSFTQAEFRGREHVAFVPLNWHALLNGVGQSEVRAMSDTVEWCFESAPGRRSGDLVSDRLPFVQTRIAQLLEARQEEERLRALALAMPAIGEGVRWHWRSFIEGRVSEYLDQVSKLESAVSDIVDRLSDQTSTQVKRLSDTSLAAVATLIGSFIASMYTEPFQAALFRIGMSAYAAYVAFFPLAIGVTSTIGAARIAEKKFHTEQSELAALLGDDRTSTIVGGRVAEAQARFTFWTRLVTVAYIVAILAAIGAAIFVPGHVVSAPPAKPSHAAQTVTSSSDR